LPTITKEQIRDEEGMGEKLAELETKLKKVDQPGILAEKIQKFLEIKKTVMKED
jgi:hypothetical protein